MAQVASLVDFRQEGPPADIGIYQLSCSVMVFQYTFSGITYSCAIRSGLRGWVLVSFGADAVTVIQAAYGALTVGRTWKEKVILKGDFTQTADIYPPSLSITEIQAKLRVADGLQINNINLNAVHDADIIGGELDGNKANTVFLPGWTVNNGIYVNNSCDCKLDHVWAHDHWSIGFELVNPATIRNILHNCKAERSVVSGFHPVSGANRDSFVDCIAKDCGGSVANPTSIGGFEILDADYNVFENCFAVGTLTPAAGFSIRTCKGNVFSNCRALDGTANGFLFTSDPVDNELIGCVAAGNTELGFLANSVDQYNELSHCLSILNSGRGFGLYTTQYFKLTGCTAIDNSVAGDGSYDGFLILNATDNELIECHSISRNVGLRQKYGFEESGTCDRNIYKDCLAVGNKNGQFLMLGAANKYRDNTGFVTANTVLSAAFAIDGVAVVTVTTAHGLAITPALQDVSLTVIEDTAVDDWAYGFVKVVSVGAVNVVAKVNVTTASATGGATAKLGIRVGKA